MADATKEVVDVLFDCLAFHGKAPFEHPEVERSNQALEHEVRSTRRSGFTEKLSCCGESGVPERCSHGLELRRDVTRCNQRPTDGRLEVRHHVGTQTDEIGTNVAGRIERYGRLGMGGNRIMKQRVHVSPPAIQRCLVDPGP